MNHEKARMEICKETRFHEAGHAIGAVISGIGLDARGIQIETDYDAITYVAELPISEWTEDWCVRRVAVKLSGGAAEMRVRDQECDRSTFQSDSHYFTDYQEGLQILQKLQTYRGQCDPAGLEEHLRRALVMACTIICDNWRKVEKVATALSSSPHLGASHVNAILDAPKG